MFKHALSLSVYMYNKKCSANMYIDLIFLKKVILHTLL